MAEPQQTIDLAALSAWLEGEPEAEPVEELAALRARLPAALALPGGVLERCRLLEAFAGRALDVTGRFRPRLLTATVPLSRELHLLVTQSEGALLDIAGGVAALLEQIDREWLRVHGGEVAPLTMLGLSLVCEALALTCLAAAPPAKGAWQRAHALGGRAMERVRKGEADDALLLYFALLAFAATQPESLTPRESSWLWDFLPLLPLACAELSDAQPEQLADVWCFDPEGDVPPVAASRKTSAAGSTLRYFSAATLAQALSARLEWLSERVTRDEAAGAECDLEPFEAEEIGLPLGLAPVEALALLRRLRGHWTSAPVREHPRRQRQYPVQVCVGLRKVWELGLGRRERGRVYEWRVLNESPGGYAIMSVAGIEAEIAAGTVLTLRQGVGQPWSVCIVRWVRSDNPDQVELGLQVMGVSFQSVQVGFRGSVTRQVAPALALAAMEPVRRHPAMLAPAGTYASRRFVFVRETDHVYVAQARALGLDMQTASVELFQYEIDPYPI